MQKNAAAVQAIKNMDITLEHELNILLEESIESAKERESSAFAAFAKPLENSIVLFGAGRFGIKFFKGLKDRCPEQVLAFCDNDPTKWGDVIDGVPVLSAADAAEKYSRDACFVIAVFTMDSIQYAAIRKQLQDLGCLRIVSYLPFYWKCPGILPKDFFFSLPHEYLMHKAEIREVFELLGNEESRRQYVSHIRFRLSGDFSALPPSSEIDHYFTSDIISLSSEEVFVDCGAYNGDTIKSFLSLTNSQFRGIFAYEPDPDNFAKLSEYRSGLDGPIKQKIYIKQCATGANNNSVLFVADASASSAVSSAGSIMVGCVSLDDELSGKGPTFIKLDVEGAEMETLAGARQIIAAHKPTLSVSVYHKPQDIWEICLFLNSLGVYRFYFATHGGGGIETVIYAIPESRVNGPAATG